ncbi:TIR domain-containing protein [Candidatus Accumulibacter regalis]|uniref:TIR domain-containing protein n=1 Tax=Candidatus Accumulibacter TaxID=327159 RepID=UPI0018FFA191|nr:toll/interleukin-1 receptor domain-containing protein [Accumulibacter sp.]MBO3714916.1 toll/interleukin-1 receptor domain-containing protein [Accumulibacter sp.]
MAGPWPGGAHAEARRLILQFYQSGTDDPLLPADLANQLSLRQFDLFISHNHHDSARVEALVCTLNEKHDLRVWLKKQERGPAKLEPQCAADICNCRFAVVAGLQAALNSQWVDGEKKCTSNSIPTPTACCPSSSSRSTVSVQRTHLWVGMITLLS